MPADRHALWLGCYDQLLLKQRTTMDKGAADRHALWMGCYDQLILKQRTTIDKGGIDYIFELEMEVGGEEEGTASGDACVDEGFVVKGVVVFLCTTIVERWGLRPPSQRNKSVVCLSCHGWLVGWWKNVFVVGQGKRHC